MSQQLFTKSGFDYTNTYWNNNGLYQKDYEALMRLIPYREEAETNELNLLRTFNNLYYDLYNNGLGNKDIKIPEFKIYADIIFSEPKEIGYKLVKTILKGKESYLEYEKLMDEIVGYRFGKSSKVQELLKIYKITITAKNVENLFPDSVDRAIDYINTFKLQYPEKIKKPFLSNKHTSVEVKQYSTDLEIYEIEHKKYKFVETYIDKYNRELNNILEKYIKEISGLNTIPEDKRSKVWSLAWERGHSDGYGEVYNNLESLVELFK
jgi:hypothetical protein